MLWTDAALLDEPTSVFVKCLLFRSCKTSRNRRSLSGIIEICGRKTWQASIINIVIKSKLNKLQLKEDKVEGDHGYLHAND